VKQADGRPVNASSALSTAGSDGTLAVGDYNAAMNDLAGFPGVDVVLVPEIVTGSAATFHANLVTLAAQVSDRIFLTWAQVHGQSIATEKAQAAAQITTRTDRIVVVLQQPGGPSTRIRRSRCSRRRTCGSRRSCSQTDIDIHAGSAETMALLAGITRLTSPALSARPPRPHRPARSWHLLARAARRRLPVPLVVVTDLTSGKTELNPAPHGRLPAAQRSAKRLRHWVKAKNTAERARHDGLRAHRVLARAQACRDRVIEDFQIDQVSVNTKAQRSQGIEKLLWRVDLIDHILALVFETEIGTGVVIQKQ
jgi:hypothetical protein